MTDEPEIKLRMAEFFLSRIGRLQLHGERAAPANFAFDRDGPANLLNNLRRKRKAQTGATFRARAHLVGAPKPVEYVRQCILLNANPRIPNRHFNVCVV